MNKEDKKIDLVYLWVDGNDRKWRKEKDFWAKKLGIKDSLCTNSCRYIDNQELKYSLRSAQMYAPWINKIFIITNGQVPKWLDTKNPKIKIVNHLEIMPKNCLPTFNSEAIETAIANIPELSEYFLCANDDKFFASEVSPNDFFDENDNPIVKFREQNWNENEIEKYLYKKSYIYTAKTFLNKVKSTYNFKKLEPIHCIEAYRKSYFLECKTMFLKEFNETMQKKFRSLNSIQHPIVDMFMVGCKGCKLIIDVAVSKQEISNKVDNLHLSLGQKNIMKKVILDKKPKLLCINDNELTQETHRKTLKNLLEELYPIKPDWEIDMSKNKDLDTSTEEMKLNYAIDKKHINYFIKILNQLKLNNKMCYEINVFTSDLDESDKNLLVQSSPKNVEITYQKFNSDSEKLFFNSELNFIEILSKIKKEDRIVLWGASNFLQDFINRHFLESSNIIGIIDRNPYLQGEQMGIYKIFKPDELHLVNPNRVIMTIINSSDECKIEIENFLKTSKIEGVKLETI